METVRSAIQNTVSISAFNKGMAGKIFDEVKRFGTKVVMKNNTAECVLMSPEEYLVLMEELEDARLYSIAKSRMENASEFISSEEVDAKFGITESDLEDYQDVEIG